MNFFEESWNIPTFIFFERTQVFVNGGVKSSNKIGTNKEVV